MFQFLPPSASLPTVLAAVPSASQQSELAPTALGVPGRGGGPQVDFASALAASMTSGAAPTRGASSNSLQITADSATQLAANPQASEPQPEPLEARVESLEGEVEPDLESPRTFDESANSLTQLLVPRRRGDEARLLRAEATTEAATDPTELAAAGLPAEELKDEDDVAALKDHPDVPRVPRAMTWLVAQLLAPEIVPTRATGRSEPPAAAPMTSPIRRASPPPFRVELGGRAASALASSPTTTSLAATSPAGAPEAREPSPTPQGRVARGAEGEASFTPLDEGISVESFTIRAVPVASQPLSAHATSYEVMRAIPVSFGGPDSSPAVLASDPFAPANDVLDTPEPAPAPMDSAAANHASSSRARPARPEPRDPVGARTATDKNAASSLEGPRLDRAPTERARADEATPSKDESAAKDAPEKASASKESAAVSRAPVDRGPARRGEADRENSARASTDADVTAREPSRARPKAAESAPHASKTADAVPASAPAAAAPSARREGAASRPVIADLSSSLRREDRWRTAEEGVNSLALRRRVDARATLRDMGVVEVRADIERDGSVSLRVNAAEASTHELVASAKPRLEAELSQSGITTSQVSVHVGTGQRDFGSQRDFGGQRHDSQRHDGPQPDVRDGEPATPTHAQQKTASATTESGRVRIVL